MTPSRGSIESKMSKKTSAKSAGRRRNPHQKRTAADYRNGGEGFILWAEDFACIPIYPEGSDIAVWYPMHSLPDDKNPETGRSYRNIWEEQKKLLKKALRMKKGRFVHRLIVLCWPRGEGKSFIACLIQMWKFFCWPRQQIMLGANSKDQVKFVHYDIIAEIIRNSPKLMARVGEKNLQIKEIRLTNNKGEVDSIIRAISSFSGIVSNITGYTFSEIFDMKNPKFFVQLDGSIRNIPNALGLIDSTVSDKTHVLYRLYNTYVKGKDPHLFFSYRYSPNGNVQDYWHPQMTQAQLDSYKEKFPFGEFERYFQNLWSAGGEKPFTAAMIDATHYIGSQGVIPNSPKVMELTEEKQKLLDGIKRMQDENIDYDAEPYLHRIDNIEKQLIPVSNYYELGTPMAPRRADVEKSLGQLGDLFGTHWVVGVGIDRADPMKLNTTPARTIITCVAKGLPKSRGSMRYIVDEGSVPPYIYVLLHLAHISTSSLDEIKTVITELRAEYSGIDMICGERWGLFDLAPWCESKNIKFEAIYPTYDRQRDMFFALHQAYKSHRFFTPDVHVVGSKMDDILVEEAGSLDHDTFKKWFGSPEKNEASGIQDDAMFSVAHCVFGLREFGPEDLKPRKGVLFFGDLYKEGSNIGDY